MKTAYTAAEIREIVPRELANLRRDFADVDWAQPVAAIMEELFEIAGTAPSFDHERLLSLRERLANLMASNRGLKALFPLAKMIDSLLDAATPHT